MSVYLGIDEAGRGAVIGPLVMAGVEGTKEIIEKLKNLNVKDSKQLTPSQRLKLYEQINELAKAVYIEIAFPPEIDEWVYNKNLNKLEENMAIKIIKKSEASVIIIDSFSTNALSIATRFQRIFKDKKIIVEHKADEKYVIVGAASIIAKVTRDWHIKKLGEEVGSGYPSDPRTREFLHKHFKDKNMHGYIRHSWETIEKMKKRGSQKTLFF